MALQDRQMVEAEKEEHLVKELEMEVQEEGPKKERVAVQ